MSHRIRVGHQRATQFDDSRLSTKLPDPAHGFDEGIRFCDGYLSGVQDSLSILILRAKVAGCDATAGCNAGPLLKISNQQINKRRRDSDRAGDAYAFRFSVPSCDKMTDRERKSVLALKRQCQECEGPTDELISLLRFGNPRVSRKGPHR